MISYDPEAKAYRLASQAEGRWGVFKIEPHGNGYVWWLPAGPATVRYTGSFDGAVWTEIGEYLAPGQPARKIFSMELRKVRAADWPGGDPVGPG